MATIHVIGAGLSGLACALYAAKAGRSVAIYEATGHAGGRCRSFHDESLGAVIDNGNHLLLRGNSAARAFMADIGSGDAVEEIAPARFPFVDLATGERWCLRPTPGRLPAWLLLPGRRVPGSSLRDYMAVYRMARALPDATVADCVGRDGVLYDRLWQPLSRAVLNTDAAEGSALLLWRMIAATLLKGEAASRPLVFRRGLSQALIDPAVRRLIELGVDIRTSARVRGLGWRNYRVQTLHFAEGAMRVGPDDAVVLAVPPEIAGELWPELTPPTATRAILNAHFRLDEPVNLPWSARILGMINSRSQWLFARGNVVSVTISAADDLVEQPSWQLANALWSEAATALGRNVGRLPPWRIIKERRATIAQTPAQDALRPPPHTSLNNLFLAGDWTATGLPCTIEGSLRSGRVAAARAILASETEEAA